MLSEVGDVKEDFGTELNVDEIKKIVESLGLIFVENMRIKGRSGIEHLFKYVVKNSKTTIAIHLFKLLTAIDVCNLQAFKVDTNIPQIALCNNSEEEAVKIALDLEIKVIKANDLEELRKIILTYFK